MEPKARRDCRMSIDYVIAVPVWRIQGLGRAGGQDLSGCAKNVIQASNFQRRDFFRQAPRAVIVGGVFFSVTMTDLFLENKPAGSLNRSNLTVNHGLIPLLLFK